MTKHLFFENKKHISSKDAATSTGYTGDYIGRLCRAGDISCTRVGRAWYVDEESLNAFVLAKRHAREARKQELAEVRRQEYETGTPLPKRAPNQKRVARQKVQPSAYRYTRPQRIEHPVTATLFRQMLAERATSALHAPATTVVNAAPSVANLTHKTLAMLASAAMVLGTLALADAAYLGTTQRMAASAQRYVAQVTDAMPRTVADIEARFNTAARAFDAYAQEPSRTLVAGRQAVAQVSATDVVRSLFTDARVYVTDAIAALRDVQTPDWALVMTGGAQSRVNVQVTPVDLGATTTLVMDAATADDEESPEPARAPVTTSQQPQTIVQQPVIERVIETQRVVTQSGVSLTDLQQLENELRQEIVRASASNTSDIGHNFVSIARTQRIDNLGDVDITNARITNSRVDATTLTASEDVTFDEDLTVGGNLTIGGGSGFGGTLTANNLAYTDTFTTPLSAGVVYINSSGELTSATGTANTLAKFNASGVALADSVITDDGSSVTVSGGLTVTGTSTLATTTITDATITTGAFTNLSAQDATTTDLVATNSATLATTTITVGTITDLTATNLTATNATTTNLFATSSTFANATATDFVATNATTTNLYSTLLTAITGAFTNLSTQDFTATNATSTNLFATSSTLVGVSATDITTTNLTADSASTTNLFATSTTLVNATATDLFATDLSATDATLTNATSTNFFSTLLTAITGVFTNLTATNATTTNLFATNATLTNATTTSFVTDLITTTSGIFTNLTATNATSTNLVVTGSADLATTTINGILTVDGGAIVIGNTTSDTLTINSAVNSDIIPDQNAVRDLGSPSYYWDEIYADNINVNSISAASSTIGGTSNNSFTINTDNVTADTEDVNLIFYRGTVVPNAVIAWDSGAERFDINQPFFIQNDSSTTTVPTLQLVERAAGQTAPLLAIDDNGSNRILTVTPDGTVGIGTTTPSEAFHVYGAGNQRMFVQSTDTGSAQFRLKNANTEWHFEAWNNAFNFVETDVANRLTILEGGNVGIGDTSPSYLLTVGDGDLFGVNSSGAIVAATGITSSGTITLSDLAGGFLKTNASGVLATSTIDLAADVSGVLPIASGGTGTTSLNNLITLGTHTTGNYLATLADAGNGFFTVANSGTESAAVTLDIADDSLDFAQFADALTVDATTTFDLDTNSADLNFDSDTLYIDSSANRVGIGTGSPDVRFRVDEDLTQVAFKVTGGSGGANIAEFTRDVGADTTVAINGDSGNAQMYFQTTGNTFALGTDGSYFKISDNTTLGTNDYFTITNTGNIGIGTTTPETRLSVDGTITSGGSSLGKLSLLNTAGSERGYLENTGSVIDLGTQNTQAITFSIDSSEKFRVHTDGNIGIGTASPQSALTIANSVGDGFDEWSDYQLLLYAGSTPQDSYGLGVKSNTLAFNTNRDFDFDQDGSTVMTINNGNVGIGDTTPEYELDVVGDIAVSDQLLINGGPETITGTSLTDFVIGSGSGHTGAVFNVATSTGISRIAFAVDGNANAGAGIEWDTSTGKLSFGGKFNRDDLTVDHTTGDVVIASDLTVGGAVRFSSLTGGVLTTNASGVLSTTTLSGSDITADSLDFTEFADALTLDASTDISVTGSNVFSITNTGTGNSFVVNDQATDTSPFVIDLVGRVGIGTSTPLAQLHAVSTTNTDLRSQATDAGASAFVTAIGGTNGKGVLRVNKGGNWWALGIDGTDSNTFKITPSSTIGSSDVLSITTGGNVGIGTTSPAYKLDVAGTLRATGLATFGGGVSVTGTTTLTGHLIPSADDTYDLGSSLARWRNLYLGPSTLYIGADGDESAISYSTSSDLLTFQNSADSSNGFQFLDADGGTPILNIDTQTERVGIGTATADAALEIASAYPNLQLNGSDFPGLEFVEADESNKKWVQFVNGTRFAIAEDSFSTSNQRFEIFAGGDVVLGKNGGNLGVGTTSPASKLDVWGDFRAGTSSTPTLFADVSTGYVGVGTASPSSPLQVIGSIQSGSPDNSAGTLIANGNGASSATGGSVWLRTAADHDTTTDRYQLTVSADDFLIGTEDTASLLSYYGGTGDWAFGNSGNVGIGTAGPKEKLHVAGDIALNTGNGLRTNLYFDGGWKYIGSGAGFAVTHGSSNDALYFATAPSGGTADAAATLINRMVLTTSGNLGIGTTTPAARLNVLSTSEQLRLAYDTTSYWTDTIASDGGRTLAGFGNDADFNINFSGATDGDFRVNGDDFIVDTSAGSVGVGGVSAGYDFSIRDTDGDGLAEFVLNNGTSTWNIANDSTNDFTVTKVGTWGAELEISNTTSHFANARLSFAQNFLSAYGDEGRIGINDTTPNAALEIVASSTDPLLALSSSGPNTGDLLIVNSSGQVGIGTTTPSETLDVNGNINAQGEIRATRSTDSTLLRAWTSNNNDLTLLRVAGNAAGALTDDASAYGFSLTYFGTGSGNNNRLGLLADNQEAGAQIEALSVLQDGSIGIGTTSPAYTLDVAGTLRATGLATFGSGVSVTGTTTLTGHLIPSADDTYDLGSSLARWRNLYLGPSTLYIGADGDESAISYSTSSDLLTFQNSADSSNGFQFLDADGGTPILNIDTQTERVGIGTATADAALEIASAYPNLQLNGSDFPGLEFVEADESNKKWVQFVNGTRFAIAEDSFSTSNQRFEIFAGGDVVLGKNGGNLGVGTTSPASKLDVWGDFRAGTSSTPTLFADVSTGYVGVGTASPSSPLQVIGSIQSGSPDNSAGTLIANGNGASSATGGSVWLRTAADHDTTTDRYQLTVSADDFLIGTEDTASLLSYYGGTGDWAFGNSGNVGIGTAGPKEKLHVAGDIALNTGNGLRTNLYFDGGWKYIGSGAGFAVTHGSSNDALYFATAPSGGTADAAATLINRMVLTTSGNLGIGTTTPAARLNVLSTSEQLRLAYDTTSYWTDTIASDGGRTLAGFGNDADFNINFSGATDGDFRVNGDDFIVDTSAGSVGVGGVSAGYDFSIRDTDGDGLAEFVLNNGTSTWNIANDSTNDFTVTKVGTWGAELEISNTTSHFANARLSFAQNFLSAYGDEGRIGINDTTPNAALEIVASSTDPLLALSSSGPNTGDLLIVNSSGQVGIGTTTPSETLDVNGNINAQGEIRATRSTDSTLLRAWTSNNNDLTLLRVAGNAAGALTDDASAYGFSLTYFGTGSGNNNRLGLLADNQEAGAQIEALSVLQDGSIGIGTTSPAYTLDVAGTLRATGLATFGSGVSVTGTTTADAFYAASGSVGSPSYTFSTEPDLGLFRRSSGVMSYVNDGDEIIIIDNAGIRAAGGGTGQFLAESASNNNPTFAPNRGDTDTGIGGDGAGSLSLITGGSSALYIASSTNVGIGTTNPLRNLVVNENGQAEISLRAGDASSAYLLLGDQSSDDRGRIQYDNSANALSLWANAIRGLTVDSSGNVGIGTTTPASPLDVWGDFRAGTSSTPTLFADVSTGRVGIGTASPVQPLDIRFSDDTAYNPSSVATNGAYIFNESNTGGYAPLFFRAHSSGGAEAFIAGVFENSNAGGLALGVETSANTYEEAVRIDASKNVGIGTTLPDYKLEVSSTGADLFRIGRTTTSIGAWNFRISHGVDGGGIGTLLVQPTVSTGDFNILDSSGNSKIIVDTSTGNVGIGTTSPSDKLHVMGRIRNTSDIFVNDDKNGNGNIQIGASSTGLSGINFNDGANSGIIRYDHSDNDLEFFTNVTQRLTINSSGYVGIGTTTPSYKLTVAHGAGDIFSVENTSDTRMVFRIDGSDNYASIEVRNFANDTKRPLLLNAFGGNVGIGTTSPQARLHLAGTGSANGITFGDGGDVSIFRNGTSELKVSGIFEVGNELQIADTGSGSAGDPDITWSGDEDTGLFRSGTNQIGVVTNGAERLTVDASGNVGIGTTNPADVLHVAGTIRAISTANDWNYLAMSSAGQASGFWDAAGDIDLYLRDDAGNLNTLLRSDGVSFINGGNVGIGTTTPDVLLTVGNENTGAGLDANEVFQFAGGSSVYGTVRNGTHNLYTGLVSTEGFIGTQTSHPFALRTGGNNRLWIDASGNVGIGTTSPSARLEVAGSGTVFEVNGGDGGVSIADFYRNGNASPVLAIRGAGNNAELVLTEGNASKAWTLGIDTSNADAFTISEDTGFGTNDHFVIDANGDVGIGTTSPEGRLDIYQGPSGAENRFLVDLSSNSNRTLTFSNPGSGAFAIQNTLTNNGTAAALSLNPNGGNVGIGTTSPTAKLHVAGEAVADYFTATSTSATTTLAGSLDVGGGALTYTHSTGVTSIDQIELGSLSFEADAGMVSWFDLPVSSTPSAGTVQSYTAQIDGTSLLTVYAEADGSGGIQNTGIGIGTTTPASLLDVWGDARVGTSSTPTLFADVSTARVGINAASPEYALDVSGAGSENNTIRVNQTAGNGNAIFLANRTASTNNAALQLQTNGSTSWTVGLTDATRTSSSTDFSILSSDSTSRLHITSSGNVGIGTTSPLAKLDVYGDAILSGTSRYLNFGSISGTSGYGIRDNAGTLQFKNSGGSWADLGSGGGGGTIDGSGVANGIAYFTDTDTLAATSTFAFSGGNVGIGTSSPATKLHVAGAGRFDGNLDIYYQAADNFSTGQRVYKRGTTGDATAAVANSAELGYHGFYGWNGSAYGRGAYAIARTTEAWDVSGYGTKYEIFTTANNATSNSVALTLDQNQDAYFYGNVGIGDASPAALLTVGNGDLFQVNSSGAIAAAAGITSSGTITFSSLTGGILTTNASGVLSTTTVSASDVTADALDFTEFADALTVDATTTFDLDTNSADLNFDSDTLYIDSSASRVGIGTASPDASLRVDEDLTEVALKVTGGNGGTNIAEFIRDVGADTTVAINGGAGDAQMYFQTTGNTFALGTDGSYFKISDNTTLGTNDYFTITNTGNVGIGDANPGSKLDVAGDINISDTSQGYKIGDTTVLYASSTLSSVLVGFGAGDALTSSKNVAIGQDALTTTSSGSNIAIGYWAMRLATGDNNTVVGNNALRSSGSGSYNSAFGNEAMQNNTSGGTNSAFGNQSLYANTTGSNNAAFGALSLRVNTTGGTNTAIGTSALYWNTTGSNNTALGYGAGQYISGGSGQNATSTTSVYLGANTKALASGNTNEIVIGYDATGLGSNTVTLGNDSITTTALRGNVGIGTTSPSALLHLYTGASGSATPHTNYDDIVIENATSSAGITIRLGSGAAGGLALANATSSIRGGIFYADAADALLLYGGGSERIRVDADGNVGIGTTTPTKRLTVTDTVADAQFLISYDGTRYAAFQVDSSGDLLIDAQGDDVRLNDENLWVCSGGSCPSGTPSGNGNVIVEASIGIGTSTPWTSLSIAEGGAITVEENLLTTSGTINVDWRDGNSQLIRLTSSAVTINLSGYIAGQKLLLTICNPSGSTGGAITWGTTISWADGSTPTQTTTANKCDVWSFIATNSTGTLRVFGAQTPNF